MRLGNTLQYDPTALTRERSFRLDRQPLVAEKELSQSLELASISLLISAYTFRAYGRRGFRARTKA